MTGGVIPGTSASTRRARSRRRTWGVPRAEFADKGLVLTMDSEPGAQVQEQIAELSNRLCGHGPRRRGSPVSDPRLAALSGGIGVLKIGGIIRPRELRRPGRTCLESALRGAAGGVVAGGGAALLHRQPAVLDAASRTADPDIALGMRALAARWLHRSAGSWRMRPFAPAVYIERLLDGGAGAAYDVFAGCASTPMTTVLLDAADVVAAILRSAVSGATMTLSTDAIVYHRKPQQSLTP